jgi:anti-sigma28 factor (negative regulator of flagellin synthesis)
MKTITDNGKYTAPNGQEVSYTYSYRDAEGNIQAIIAEDGEKGLVKSWQRMEKVDANNTAREKAKVVNGHSTRQPLSEEQKAKNKAEKLDARLALIQQLVDSGMSQVDAEKLVSKAR